MSNERANKRTLTIAVIGAMLLAIIVISISTAGENAFAYKKNEATAQANDCGNGFVPGNVGCQNLASQIQGDENSAALTAQQTFPATESSPPTEPSTEPPVETCVECFTRFLSDTEILRVELQLERLATVNTVEQGCTLLETDPEERAINIGVTGRVLDAAHIAEPTTIQES